MYIVCSVASLDLFNFNFQKLKNNFLLHRINMNTLTITTGFKVIFN